MLPLLLDWYMAWTGIGLTYLTFCGNCKFVFSISYEISKHGVVDLTRSFGGPKVAGKTGVKVKPNQAKLDSD